MFKSPPPPPAIQNRKNNKKEFRSVPPELGKHKNGKQHNGNSQNVKTEIRQIHKMSKPQKDKCIKRQNPKMANP